MADVASDVKSDIRDVKDKLRHVSRGTWIGLGVAALGIVVVIYLARKGGASGSTPTLGDILGTGDSGGSTLGDPLNSPTVPESPTAPTNPGGWPSLPPGTSDPLAPILDSFSTPSQRLEQATEHFGAPNAAAQRLASATEDFGVRTPAPENFAPVVYNAPQPRYYSPWVSAQGSPFRQTQLDRMARSGL